MEKNTNPSTDKEIPFDNEQTKDSTENGSVLLAIDHSAEKSYGKRGRRQYMTSLVAQSNNWILSSQARHVSPSVSVSGMWVSYNAADEHPPEKKNKPALENHLVDMSRLTSTCADVLLQRHRPCTFPVMLAASFALRTR